MKVGMGLEGKKVRGGELVVVCSVGNGVANKENVACGI
jgi:hypothetical protein